MLARASLAARTLHARTLPYQQLARIDKPIGTYLLYLPCTWSILLAGAIHPELYPVTTTAGTLAMCTVNDLWDRDFDKKVERTKTRPLAAGTVTVPQAVAFLGVQLAGGAAVLSALNWNSILLGSSSLVLVALYPAMKRITYYPQFILGLTFNWGALVGYTAMTNTLPLDLILPMYGAGVCWTLVYDTLYAHQDKKDDVAVGVKSTALAFADRTKPILTGLSVLAGAGLVGTGVVGGLGPAYFAGAAGAVGNMVYVTWKARLDDPASCGWAFRASKWAGVFLAAGLAVEYGLKVAALEDEDHLDSKKTRRRRLFERLLKLTVKDE
ncbi:para-hydroxybenzoate-polyprenyltransferase [Catenaria anguillulae PL171]|uniref:4-hydroxybenzoate polyprenyltransferase, mitochondrial n=1 Tax=Catenaria anguillulae PL171 TaxID=765915 RepID=A0A1Y2H8N4_9FUNG|nr:para-hydroxybenzoate-polyprenyltransferase [Catenaria anguillulae PL171]